MPLKFPPSPNSYVFIFIRLFIDSCLYLTKSYFLLYRNVKRLKKKMLYTKTVLQRTVFHVKH
ncbi:hypothetical protein QY96_01685 [Bacillus thermotolerans]|nr:hypothetical protein QY96_01685 [Bacillus thermotolerans]